MKLFSNYPGAAVGMRDSPELRGLLRDVVMQHEVRSVIETGTHVGLGSTTFVAQAFSPDSPPQTFRTIEANWRSWCQAKRNLKPFPFVECIWGHALNVDEAIAFVQTDAFIRDRDLYEDVFIDDIVDPVAFYSKELRGRYGSGRLVSGLANPTYLRDRLLHFGGEDVLGRSIGELREGITLVVLDAAGGSGLLEFRKVLELMKRRPYLLLLDDIHHVKHYRSRQQVEGDASFEVLGLDISAGWMLAARNL